MALRRSDGFKRFAMAVQYHGASFLGFSYHGNHTEDCILPDGTDLRGYRTVEGRIREALDDLLTTERWENLQVSSRTDRGVHALKNTFHVDIQCEDEDEDVNERKNDSEVTNLKNTHQSRLIQKLPQALNYRLSHQTTSWSRNRTYTTRKQKRNAKINFDLFEEDQWQRHSVSDELRILGARQAPEFLANPYSQIDTSQPPQVDWNARFSATQRTYVYRILHFRNMEDEYGVPFEWDRSWRIKTNNNTMLDIQAMQTAAKLFEGTHDFTSFRGRKCQRKTPLVHMSSVQVDAFPYQIIEAFPMPEMSNHPESKAKLKANTLINACAPTLITVTLVGDAFLYRQVRNMIACLVEIGKGTMKPQDVSHLLLAKDRTLAPGMAPPHGLFLADVQHGDFSIL